MTDVYVSCDVETDGPIPGPHSMLSLGAAAFVAPNKEPISTFSVNLSELPGAAPDPDTLQWWKSQPDAWAACRKDLKEPRQAMTDFVTWVEGLPGIQRGGSGAVKNAVFVGYPAGFDFTWTYQYIRLFKLNSPFSFSALDIKTFAMAVMGTSFRESVKRNMPKAWFPKDRPHTHVAVEDAVEQGILFLNILEAANKLREGR